VKHRARPSRLQLLLREVSKFGVVGAVAYVVDFVVSNLCHTQFHMDQLLAKTVSTVVAATVSYIGNRKWSFAHRASSGVRREYTLFFLLNAVGLGITLLPLGFAEYVLHLKGAIAFNLFGNVLGTGLGTVFRFWSYKKWVFLHPEDPRAVVSPESAAASRVPEPASR
jgi:putative flippase GtrA